MGTVKHAFTSAKPNGPDATLVRPTDWNADHVLTGVLEATLADAKGDLLVASAADAIARLAVGADTRILMADAAQALGVKWAISPETDLIVAKGDLLVGTAVDTLNRLAVGANGRHLAADSAASEGVKWERAWIPALKTADETIQSDAVLSADAVLKFAMAANTKYALRAWIFFAAKAASDFKWGTNGPAIGAGRIEFVGTYSRFGAAPTNWGDEAYDTVGKAITHTADFNGFVQINGIIHNGATAGDFEFTWAQNTSVAENTSVLAASILEHMPV